MNTKDAATAARVEPIVISSFDSDHLPVSELDDGIRDLVIAMNRDGFVTCGSCEGGTGHAFELPTIVFARTEDNEKTRRELTEWLINHDVFCFTISVRYHHQSSIEPESYSHVRVELWSLDTLRYLTF